MIDLSWYDLQRTEREESILDQSCYGLAGMRGAACFSYAYFSEHVADESSFVFDGRPIEWRMEIHVRRVAIRHGRSDGFLTLTAAR